ncbi:maleylpyruvate isomerase N-terminal domain-containing protein [Micromonospora sp. STR1_7]|uniref:Maleylpyruvate isomerase N-terminal domain-containing protein n=1 Tax=Micromonospora parastrephiae TaxID=2806101 RepID=A0ABS1XSE1_9ACTN|nr:maleylpyruvate isomerase N-terminal domain-containing protein [Micromonospora parastrephiae]MBM0232185.1 maleylpyruvate isomerase N-terminal domain-containing protein [Micromonospora parastrephiae]
MSRPADSLDSSFPLAASIALDLIRRPEVSEQWSNPSALPHMSVGALACHLGRQAVRAAELLPAPSDLPTLETADSHYERAAWVTEGTPDEESVAAGPDEADALRGPADLHARSARALDEVSDLLSRGAARDVVPIPWQGWSLRRGEFLLTRQLEIVVHSDDLAVSVGVPTPVFPAEVFDPVRDLLVRLAVRRHGQSALISALSRTERARDISAF